MNGPDYDPLAYDGRAPYRNTGGAPKPRRFDEMVRAAAAGDTNLFEALRHEYLTQEANS